MIDSRSKVESIKAFFFNGASSTNISTLAYCFGYVFGGTPDTSKTCRIDYASDTSTAAPKGDLAQNSTYGSGATGNSNFGYITYGRTIGARGLIKMDYSNDTTTTDMGNIFPTESYYQAGMSAAYNGFG